MTARTAKRAEQGVDVIDALKMLLADGKHDAVVELFVKLLATHEREMRSLLESMRRRGTKNESMSSAQLALLFEELEEMAKTSTSEADAQLKHAATSDEPVGSPADETKPRKPPSGRRPLPANLPRIENVIRVPDEERACARCGKERATCGHEESSVIEIEPARAIVRVDRREKLAPCDECDGDMTIAPLGDKVIPGGAYGPNLVTDLFIGKYDDGLPLHRQRERYRRLGLDLPTSSMGDQVAWVCELLTPIWRGLFEESLVSDNLHLDGTSLPVLDKDSPLGIKTGQLWGYVGSNIVVENGVAREDARAVYLFTSTGKKLAQKKGELGPEDVLEMRRERGKPHVIADAAGLFDASFNRPGLLECGCNMHGRRYFKKALDAGDARAALPLGAFKKLYKIEEELAGKVPEHKLEVRQRDSRPVYEELVSWAETYRANEPPSSLLGKAVRYLTNHHIALMQFLDDGSLPIDNGIVERIHRRPAMGRRNYLFAGSDVGGERAAIAYSVLGTLRLLGINPREYLADVLPRLARGLSIARDLPALMPAAWLRARA